MRSTLGAAMLGTAALVLSACAAPGPVETSVPMPLPIIEVERSVAPEGELPEALQASLQSALDGIMAEYDVTGAVAGVWVPGEGAWTAAAGLADIETGLPTSTDMQWPLRSLTKSYTVTLILQLADEGVISLDDTLDEYVEGVTNGEQITLRELASMAAGIADYTNLEFLEVFTEDPGRLFTLDELNEFALGQPELFAPGEGKVYSNASINLLGTIVEITTGLDFATALEQRILTPLGQTGTRYITDVTTWTDPHPTGYSTMSGELEAQPDNLSIYGPAGSMISTLDDTRAWVETLATGAFLTPATQSQRTSGAPLQQGPPYDLYGMGIGETAGYWGHNGEGFGFTAAMFHNPETGVSIVVFMNVSDTPNKDHPADLAFRALAAALAEAGL
jgi:D-alanyl-D-alanine carboxypeptidase